MAQRKKIMRNHMNWIKIIFINILVLLFLLIGLELSAGIARVLIGKDFRIPLREEWHRFGLASAKHPCNEMRTDVLLSHVPNHRNQCKVKSGEVFGEYVKYNSSSPDLPLLLTLGGSTTSGFEQDHSLGDTYPKELAALAKKKYFVLNGGINGYSSLQELLKFVRDGPRFKNLKLVISLNGINEMQHYQGDPEIRSQLFPFLTQLQFGMNEHQVWIDQRVKGFFVNFQYILPNIHSLVYLVITKIDISINYTHDSKLSEHISKNWAFNPIYAAERWKKNVQRLNQLVRLEGGKYYVFLQPTMGLVGEQSKPPKGSPDKLLFDKINKDYLTQIRNLYADLKNYCDQLNFCIDISEEVYPTGSVYDDERHHNSEGNKLLSKVIWNQLKSLGH